MDSNKTLHKITVNKSDETTLIVEKILDAKTSEIVLTVPRFSKLVESAKNFKLLKREAETIGKRLVVESIDDVVLELCRANGIEHFNPFFGDSGKQFSDIVGAKHRHEPHAELVASTARRSGGSRSRRTRRPNMDRTRSRRIIKISVSVFAIAAVIGLIIGFATLPRADIRIAAAKTNWTYDGGVVVDQDVVTPDPDALAIPGQVFTQEKNLQLSFPASGTRQASERSRGTITIVNEYGSASQPLVVRTRFVSPNGKVYRLVKGVVVPGSSTIDGVFKPGRVTAAVVADKPGGEYNIGPVERFSIPGFSGTPKYDSFYGVSEASMEGGFVGEAAYPTNEEIKRAKETASKTLEESIRTLMLAQLPQGLMLLDGASRFRISRQDILIGTGEAGTFTVSTAGTLTIMLFRESDLIDLLFGKLELEIGKNKLELRNQTVNYGSPSFDAEAGRLTVPISYKGTFAKKIDIEALKARIAGKSEKEIKPFLFSIAGLESAKISLWPFWVRRVPQSDKITITVD